MFFKKKILNKKIVIKYKIAHIMYVNKTNKYKL